MLCIQFFVYVRRTKGPNYQKSIPQDHRSLLNVFTGHKLNQEVGESANFLESELDIALAATRPANQSLTGLFFGPLAN